MDIKKEIIYPEDTVQIFMQEEQDIEDCSNIKQENVFFEEQFDERDIKQETNLFVKEEFEDGQIFGTDAFTNEEDLSDVKDNASISTLGTSFNKKGKIRQLKEKITCLGCHHEFVNLKTHFLGPIGTTCKQKYLENLDNSNYLVHIQKARKRKVKIDEFVFCKGCSKPFQRLLTHLNPETGSGKSCREFYSAEELKLQNKEKAKEKYQKNKEARKKQMKENYQKNREARKKQMKENYQKNREAQTEKMKEKEKEKYQKNKEARKKQMKENYQKNRESRKNQLKENYIKRKLLIMETVEVIKEDDNNDEIDKDIGEDESDDEEVWQPDTRHAM